MSCGVGRRLGLDLVLLWLWPVAVAPILLLAWEPPYAVGAAQEMANARSLTHCAELATPQREAGSLIHSGNSYSCF